MKTLYININNEQIQSNEELEVLKHDLDSDFFFYLGEKIAKGCNEENENALITDFNTQDNVKDYEQIIAQWNKIKTILFSEECEGEVEFTLPYGYIHWLRYSEKYNSVYDRNFSHGETAVITIDLEELYEDSIEDLRRKILRKLQRDDLYLEIDEIVFNDDAVTRKSPIVRTIKEKYDSIKFKVYKEYMEISSLFPFSSYGFILGVTSLFDFIDDENSKRDVEKCLKDGIIYSCNVSGVEFTYDKKGILSECKIESNTSFPNEWVKSFAWNWNLRLSEWVDVLDSKNFIVYLTEGISQNGHGRVLAQSQDLKYRILVSFENARAKYMSIDCMPDKKKRKNLLANSAVNQENATTNNVYNLDTDCVVDALVKWVCIGYYNESKIDLRNDKVALSRIQKEAIKVVKKLKSENNVDFDLPYISSSRYKHIHITISKSRLRDIVSKSSYKYSDFLEPITYDADQRNPESITCPLCGFTAEYDGDVYYCINCKIYLMEGYGKVCPQCHCDDVVQDLDSGTCYCLKCKNNWIE